MRRILFAEVGVCVGGTFGIEYGAVAVGKLRSNQCRKSPEVRPRGFAETHRSIPDAGLLHRSGDVYDRVVQGRSGSMACGAVRYQADTLRILLRVADEQVARLPGFC